MSYASIRVMMPIVLHLKSVSGNMKSRDVDVGLMVA